MPTRPQRTLPIRRKRVLPPGLRRARGAGALMRRRRMMVPSGPTFTETYLSPVNGGVILGNAGGIFQVRISDIPQIADYQALYRQYRINWVKVIVVPELSGTGVDVNTLYQNNAAGLAAAGQARIAYVVNDTPGIAAPANEGQVLEDNGCKIRVFKSMFSASFRPVPEKLTGDAAGGPGVFVRERKQPFLSFADPAVPGNNPLHNGISYWISHYTAALAQQSFKVYYKVNFSLRDPQ